MEDDELVQISALEHFSYCKRQYALIYVEQVFEQNIFTVRGNFAHERTDESIERQEGGMRVERALPLWSQRFGLVGRADTVEFHGDVPYPIEYKVGQKRLWHHEAIQVCAQALCLEEMFGVEVPLGAIYYCASRTRREVIFDQSLRTTTIEMIDAVRALQHSSRLPAAVQDERCEECSLKEACMPGVVKLPTRLRSYRSALFGIEEGERGA